MATKATIYRVALNIADMDEHNYSEHNLTVAKHPSENDLRLMVRVVAFILNADEDLIFCKGIDEDGEPDLWQKDLSGDIKLWIDLGQPDEKRIKKACSKSEKVIIYTYQKGMAEAWFKQIERSLKRFKNLSVVHIGSDANLEQLVQRSMALQCNTIDRELTLIDDDNSIIVTKETIF